MLARMDAAAPDYSIVLPAYNEEALLLAIVVGFLFFPFLVRSRRHCWLWYRRPAPPAGRALADLLD